MSQNNIDSMNDILSQFAFKKPVRANQKPPSNPTPQKSTSTKRSPITNDTCPPHKQNLKKVKLTQEKPVPEKTPPVVKEKPKAKPKKKDTSDPNFTVMEVEDEEDFNILPHANPKKPKRAGGFKKQEPEFGVEYDPENSRISLGSINLPEWAKEENIRDENLRAPGQPGYDPTTLYIPQNALNRMPTLMKKYWEVKSQNYEKLVFIRLHKAYFVYHKDAYIVHTEANSMLYNHKTLATAYVYPPKVSNKSRILIEKGYKIILVEPTQTYETKDEANLEIYQIMTKGTFIEPNSDNLTSRYCLVLTENKDLQCGFCYMDTTTHEFFMGEFQDTPNRTQLKSLLLKTTPVEIVFREKTLSKETVQMMKNLYWKPIITSFVSTQPVGMESVLYRLKRHLDEENSQELLQRIVEMAEEYNKEGKEQKECPNYWVLQGIYLALEYLEYLYLADIVFRKGNFFLHYWASEAKKNMMLDGQTVYNLELVDVAYLNNTMGGVSLLKYMDKTKTAIGKRMFRKWLLEPLQDVEKINERLDAVGELLEVEDLREIIQGKVGRLSDIERLIHGIYNFGTRKIVHSMDFEAYIEPKIRSFVEVLGQLREADSIMKGISEYGSKMRSKRLKMLLSFKESEGLLPEISTILDELESMLITKDNTLVPAPGKDSGFDKLMEEASEIKRGFQRVLEAAKSQFKCEGIIYIHIKQRYELEIPEHLVEGTKKPKEFLPTSKKKGYLRFHTPEIQDLLQKLEDVEYRMHKVVLPYVVKCFKHFYSFHDIWQQVIRCLAELDCLASLAQLARNMPHICRPNVIAGDQISFDLRGVIHPCLAMKSPKFVKNDIVLEQDKNVFLITGPNMGGKSTLMRTVCIATIMAQIGSYVPADSFTLTPRDRIFTRIGASDNIFEGKSTFFVELEETLNIVNEATERSLVIIDELGRGTSTYDGMAIAYSVLKYLTENVKCMTMFATHFHMLLEEFRLYKSVEMYYMESEFVGDEVVEFLYNFRKGRISNSFGLSVARMAGLPQKVIEKGREKAEMMGSEQGNIVEKWKILSQFTREIELLKSVEEDGSQEYDVEDVLKKLESGNKFSLL